MSTRSDLLPTHLSLDRLQSPIGTLLLVTDQTGALRALDFDDYESRTLRLLRAHYGSLPLAAARAPACVTENLASYFAGKLEALRAINWATGGTALQRAVWQALTEIPPGETQTYGALARKLGESVSPRAVGWANGSNPVALVVPCHRVIGASGALTGYAGGLHRKEWLLRHEGASFAGRQSALAL